MKVTTSPVNKVESPRIRTKNIKPIVSGYREKAELKGNDFLKCFNTVFAVLQSNFGEEDVGGKYKGYAEQEKIDCETAWKFVEFCERIESGEIIERDNVVRRNPETGRFDFFYHGK